MYTNSRVIFYLKGNESVLLEARFGSENETVKVSYLQGGVPFYRGFLYPTALHHLETQNWIVVSRQSLIA